LARERDPKKYDCPHVIKMNKEADKKRKLDEERALKPVFRRKPKDTTIPSSINFYRKWQA
jgi:hypothetical protein